MAGAGADAHDVGVKSDGSGVGVGVDDGVERLGLVAGMRDDGGDEYACGHTGGAESCDRLQAAARGRGVGFEGAPDAFVEGAG